MLSSFVQKVVIITNFSHKKVRIWIASDSAWILDTILTMLGREKRAILFLLSDE